MSLTTWIRSLMIWLLRHRVRQKIIKHVFGMYFIGFKNLPCHQENSRNMCVLFIFEIAEIIYVIMGLLGINVRIWFQSWIICCIFKEIAVNKISRLIKIHVYIYCNRKAQFLRKQRVIIFSKQKYTTKKHDIFSAFEPLYSCHNLL